MVEEVKPYPLVPIPAHVGVTLFSPAIHDYFLDLFDVGKKSDFEGVLFPILADRQRLYSAVIPDKCWLQVNDPKVLNRLIEVMEEEQVPGSPSVRPLGSA